MKKTINQVTIECIKGDITKQEDMETIVNAANAELKSGGGVAGAIHRQAGEELEKETKSLAPLKPGEAVITAAYGLPNKHIIHCLGPVYGQDHPEDQLLGDCYRKALEIAEDHDIATIAFPAISTGAFGYPMNEAKKVVFSTIAEIVPTLQKVKIIRLVLHSEGDLMAYEEELSQLN